MHSQPGLRSFYKPCSKKFGFYFWVRIPIQWYKNNSGYNTGGTSLRFSRI